MNAAENFVSFFRDSFGETKEQNYVDEISKDFFVDFVKYTPIIETELYSFLQKGEMGKLYSRLNDLKYLCAFNDDLNKYWFMMRAMSGALNKLMNPIKLENAKKIHEYYLHKYGARKVLKDENWFENRRWHFLDSLGNIHTEERLSDFIQQNLVIMRGLLDTYSYYLESFINEIEKEIAL